MSSSALVPALAGLLVGSRSVSGGSDANAEAVVLIERLQFRSLDEEMLLQAQLEERQRQQQTDRWIGRAIGAALGLLFGAAVDGFDAGDLTSGFVAGAMGGLAADGLNQLSDQELRQYGFEWATKPDSFLFHRRRHGSPCERVLVIHPSNPGEPWQTSHGVRFSDGYIALFSPDLLACDAPLMDGVRVLAGVGITPDPHQPAQPLGSWPCSDGRLRPVEFLHTDTGHLLVMPAAIPHHSIY